MLSDIAAAVDFMFFGSYYSISAIHVSMRHVNSAYVEVEAEIGLQFC